ncbi:cation/H(+) antiporter 1-like [Aristolochia californica]|uniref:cation/H(+) antiporter 1-like n=1 Tax=Aristolochia californica TaxID=171875 RepID=UPI0035D66AD1
MEHGKDLPASCDPMGNGMLSRSTEALISICVEGFFLLWIGSFLHRILKYAGQPRVISQILAGVVLGPTFWSRDSFVTHFFFPRDPKPYLLAIGTIGRGVFMFLVGLELDVGYLWKTKREAAVVAYSGMFSCVLLALIFLQPLYTLGGATAEKDKLFIFLSLLLSNTASPILIRMCAELRFGLSDLGRLAVSSALLNDLTCFFVFAVATSQIIRYEIKSFIVSFSIGVFIMVAMTFLLPWMVRKMNNLHPNRKTLKFTEILWLLVVLWATSSTLDLLGFNGMTSWFILGLTFPREGKARRTLLQQLVGPVHNVVLPVYFGYTGFHANFRVLSDSRMSLLVFAVVGLSTLGKLVGTLAAATYLKLTLAEGLVLSFLLNVKGHVHIIILSSSHSKGLWTAKSHVAILTTVVLCTVITGPVVTWLIHSRKKALQVDHLALEENRPDGGLRLLVCVYNANHITSLLSLIEASSGPDRGALITVNTLHLVELTEKATTNLLYQQRPEDEDEEDDLGGEDGRIITDTVDSFIRQSGISVNHRIICSSFDDMHLDVCSLVEDTRGSIIILPFHKHQRLDGSMEVTEAGYQTANLKVLRRVRCTVGILVDRRLNWKTHASALDVTLNVVVIFFGGPDDREATSYAARIAEHSAVSMTLLRFLPLTDESEEGVVFESNKNDEVLMAIPGHDTEGDADAAFLSSFSDRYVTRGLISYQEKYARNSVETVNALSALEGFYSLYIVGKGGQSLPQLTEGMSEWEECPELGPIGDLLASSDFITQGSVLVIRQYRNSSSKSNIDNEFEPL